MKQSHSAINIREHKTPASRVRRLDLNDLSFSQKAALYTYSSKYKKPPSIKVPRSKVPLRNPNFEVSLSKFTTSPTNVKSLQVSPKNARSILDHMEIQDGQYMIHNGISPVLNPQVHQNHVTPSHKAESYKEESVVGSVENDKDVTRKELHFRFPGFYKVLKPEKSFEPVFKNLNSSIDSKHRSASKPTDFSFDVNPTIKINKSRNEKSFLNNLEEMYFEELKTVKKETSRLFLPHKSPYIGTRDKSNQNTPKSRKISRVPSYIPPNDGSFVLEALKTPYQRKLPEIRSPTMKDRTAAIRLKEMQAKAEILRTVKKIEAIGTPKKGNRKILINNEAKQRESISRSLFSAESNLLSLNSSNTKYRFMDDSRMNFLKQIK